MFQRFYPREDYISPYQIPFEKYFQKGYRGILFDVDNTLVEHGQPATPRAVRLFAHLRTLGFRTCVISNNKDERVKSFADAVQTDYIYKAGKPSVRGYQKGMRRIGTEPGTTLFVGDQIFTDVWGANRAGIYTILVKQVAEHEEIQIVLKRKLERIVMRGYWKRRHCRRDL